MPDMGQISSEREQMVALVRGERPRTRFSEA